MKKICTECKEEFECYDKLKHAAGMRIRSKRQYNAKTCGPVCSRNRTRRLNRIKVNKICH